MVRVMLIERLPLALCGLWILMGPERRPGAMVAGVLALWVLYTVINGWATTGWGTFVSRGLNRSQRSLLSGLGFTLSAFTGLAVVPLVGMAITSFGLTRGYGGAFLAAGLMLTCSCLVFLRADETPYPHVKERVSLAQYLRQMGPVLRADRRYRWFLAVMALWLAGSTGSAYFTVYAMERFQADAGTVMGYTIAMSLGSGLAGMAGARVASRVGFVRVFLVGIGLTAASMVAAALTPVATWTATTRTALRTTTTAPGTTTRRATTMTRRTTTPRVTTIPPGRTAAAQPGSRRGRSWPRRSSRPWSPSLPCGDDTRRSAESGPD